MCSLNRTILVGLWYCSIVIFTYSVFCNSTFAQLSKLDVPESEKHAGLCGNVRVDDNQLAFEFDSGRRLQAARSAAPDNALYREYFWENNVGRHCVFWPVDNGGDVKVHFADETVPEIYWIVSGSPKATNNSTGDCLDAFECGSITDSDGRKARLIFKKNEGLIVDKKAGIYRNGGFVGWLKIRFSDGTICVGTNGSGNSVQKGDQVRQLIRWRQASGELVDGVYYGARPAYRDDYEAAVLVRTTEGLLELPFF